MVTIGDVMGIVAFLSGLGVTGWALTVAYGLLFPIRVERARLSLAMSAKACIGWGIVMFLPLFFGFALLNAANPGAKVLGWMVMVSILAMGVFGLAAVAHVAGDRIRRLDPDMTEYAAFVRGSAFVVVGAMLPIVGWFVFLPILLLAALGSGFRAIVGRVAVPAIGAEA